MRENALFSCTSRTLCRRDGASASASDRFCNCPAGCGGPIPQDTALGLGVDRLSAGATRVVALAGVIGRVWNEGEPFRRQAAQVGMEAADRWVTVSDGGAGIKDWVWTYFQRV